MPTTMTKRKASPNIVSMSSRRLSALPASTKPNIARSAPPNGDETMNSRPPIQQARVSIENMCIA